MPEFTTLNVIVATVCAVAILYNVILLMKAVDQHKYVLVVVLVVLAIITVVLAYQAILAIKVANLAGGLFI